MGDKSNILPAASQDRESNQKVFVSPSKIRYKLFTDVRTNTYWLREYFLLLEPCSLSSRRPPNLVPVSSCRYVPDAHLHLE